MLAKLRSIRFWLFVFATTGGCAVAVLVARALTFPVDRLRKVGHGIGRFWARSTLRTNPAWHFTVSGAENLGAGPYVIISNHESTIDPSLVMSLPIHLKVVAKAELFRIPLMGWAMRACGYIELRRGDRDSIARTMAEAEAWIRRGVSVLFFPEGTRSRDGQVGPFKRGAFDLALRTGAPILPITLAGTARALPKDSWWFNSATEMQLHIDPPIAPADGAWEPYAERVREVVVKRRAALAPVAIPR